MEKIGKADSIRELDGLVSCGTGTKRWYVTDNICKVIFEYDEE
ncbi:hypothetical protein IBTHAUMO2_170064 [Nitrosopumilaceae archaeon]|nr:hypothetical protein IBTHAUMO2_170064 [Nitrosopumilaceae archaeon]